MALTWHGRNLRLRRWQAPAAIAVVAVVVLAVAAAQLWSHGNGAARAASTPPQLVLAGQTLEPDYCHTPASGPFEPTTISIPGITRRAPVLALPRDANDIPSPLPLTEAGKHEFAWDESPSPKPGSARGNVLLNAHTWPWTSTPAMGNLMLTGLRPGHLIVVHGADTHQCYRVTKQVEIGANESYPAYYSTTGDPQLAFMVCSGERLGPGNWANRMIWFASPLTS